jgi:hypothetical protein
MSNQSRILLVALAAIIGWSVFQRWNRLPVASAPMTPAPVSPVVTQPPAPAPPPPMPAVSDAPPIAPEPVGSPELDQIKLMLRNYRTLFGDNPIGSNTEIMKAIMGDNPKGSKLGPPEGMQLNGAGELVDQWGTPFFFHQLSAQQMEIRSAGPDKKLWTADDVLSR